MKQRSIYINNYIHSVIVYLKNVLDHFNIPYTNITIDGICSKKLNVAFIVQDGSESFKCLHDRFANFFTLFNISDGYDKPLKKWNESYPNYPPKEFAIDYERVKGMLFREGVYIGKHIKIEEIK